MDRGRIGAVAVLTVVAALALSPRATTDGHRAARDGRAKPEISAQRHARAAISGLTGRVATSWIDRRSPSGLFRDPSPAARATATGPRCSPRC